MSDLKSLEFKEWPKIPRFEGVTCVITQKIHGTNAQIFIDTEDMTVTAGSRTRWLTPEHDNYGFAAWVRNHQHLLIDILGPGRHYGEWAGPGINSGEGLTAKTFFIFNTEHPLVTHLTFMDDMTVITKVPKLYEGKYTTTCVAKAMNKLKKEGSKAAPGYMHPEGVVVNINGKRYKKVFKPEETKWKGKEGERFPKKERQPKVDVSNYLQPVRLEKVLSKDSTLKEGYPSTMGEIVKQYTEDLLTETPGIDYTVIKKELCRGVFTMVKEILK